MDDVIPMEYPPHLDPSHEGRRDGSVYTGLAGIALLYYRMYCTYECDDKQKHKYLHMALRYVEGALSAFQRRRERRGPGITFLTGDPGAFAVAAAIFAAMGQYDKVKAYTKELAHLFQYAIDENVDDELLYGRAGYLYACAFANQHIGQEGRDLGAAVPENILERVAQAIIKSGRRQRKKETPLMWQWHGKEYVGAAHGMVGILYILVTVTPTLLRRDQSIYDDVLGCARYVRSLTFSSGNIVSSAGDPRHARDRLVQFCHGACGVGVALCKISEFFAEPDLHEIAVNCGNVVWARGLLMKGSNLCHGITGNGYLFLCLYRYTGDERHLHRARQFARIVCCDKRARRLGDHPMSLFEGEAGNTLFLADVLNPQNAAFPAFYL